MDLAVNKSKTKYMFSTSRDVLGVDSRITADNYTFDTVKDFLIRFNSELYEFLNDIDVVQEGPARRVFNARICGNRRGGRPCIRWKYQIEEALSSIGVTNWRRRAVSRGALWDCYDQLSE